MKTQEPGIPKAINVRDDYAGLSDYLPKESLDSINVIHDLYSQKKIKFVVQLLETLLKQYPQDPYVIANAGYMYFFCDKRQKGYDILKRNFELHPDNLYAKCYFARVCMLMNKLDEAYDVFEGKLILEELYPDKTEFYVGELSELLFTFGLFFSKIGLVKSVYFNIIQLKQFLSPEHPYVQELYEELKAKKVNIDELENEIALQKAALSKGKEADNSQD